MKKTFTFFARYLSLLVLALLSSNFAWGEEHTGTFKKITSEDDLTTGYYVITASGSNNALGATVNTNKRIEGVSVTITDGAIVNPSTTIVYLITKNTDGFSFKNESTGKYMYQSGITSGKGMGFQDGEINIVLDGYNSSSPIGFKFILNGESNNYFKYNTSSKWFANYSNDYTTTMTPVELYKLGGVPTAVATPTFTPAESDFTNENISVTLACETEGASIYYTLDGTEPTKASTQYTSAISIDKTTTVKAIAYKGTDASNVASKTFTKVVPLATMDAIFEASATEGNYWITFNSWVVSGVKGNNAYLTDNAGKGLIIYKKDHGFEAGDILKGTVKCSLTKYNGSAEITDLTSSTEGLTVTKNGTLNTVGATIADLGGVNTGAYINLGTLTYNGTEFTDGSNTIKPYNTFITLPSLTNGKKYNVKGVYIQYNDIKEIAPLTTDDFEEVASTEYDITINPSTNGTVAVDADDNKAQEGQVVTLTVTPNAHYSLESLIVTDASSNAVSVSDNKFTMPASNVTISATFTENAKYFVLYSSLGEEVGEGEEVYDGEIASLPTPGNTPEGLTFVGWTAEENYASASVAPELYTSETPVTDDVILYAVFAKKIAEGGLQLTKMKSGDKLSDGDKIVIVAHDTDVAMYQETVSTSYVNKYTFDEEASTVSADDKNWLTVTLATGGFNLGDATNGYIYSSSNNLYCGEQTTPQVWTLLDNEDGTFKIQSDGRNLSYRSDLSNKYWRMGGASYGAAGQTILDIYKYEASAETYSGYTTYVTYNVTISDAGWATAYVPFNATVSDNVTAYYVKVEDGALVKTEADVIPAGTGVLLKSNDGNTATATFTAATAAADEVKDNMLVGALTETTFSEEDTKYFILANGTNGVGFYFQGADNTTGSTVTCAAGKAVLAVPTAKTGAKAFFLFDDEPLGIKEINNAHKQDALYNLNGVRVNGNYNGIVIINGKKVIK